MSTYEVKKVVEDARLPRGYTLSYHQIRGYDSPDKWWEVASRGRRVGTSANLGYSTQDDAVQAALEHRKVCAGRRRKRGL